LPEHREDQGTQLAPVAVVKVEVSLFLQARISLAAFCSFEFRNVVQHPHEVGDCFVYLGINLDPTLRMPIHSS